MVVISVKPTQALRPKSAEFGGQGAKDFFYFWGGWARKAAS